MPAFLAHLAGTDEAAGADLLLVPLALPAADLHARLRKIGPGVATAAARALDLGDFRAEPGQRLLIHSVGFEAYPRILLMGLPAGAEATPAALRKEFASAVADPVFRRVDTVSILGGTELGRGAALEANVAAAVDGIAEGAYSWTLSTAKPASCPGKWTLLLSNARDLARAKSGLATGKAVADGVTFARDLANTPANLMGPAELGEAALSLAGGALKVKVLSGAQMQKARLEAILQVGRGSARPPRLIVAEYRPRGTAHTPPIALVGKGLVYDTGGLSIKPTASMSEMKFDKCGGCVVLGAMKTVSALKLPHPVVAIVPAVENSISGESYRPGDIIGSRAGKTIEVLNTDAEGRLALADGLDYAISEYGPRAVVDAATLTGAVYHALSDRSCGVLGSDDKVVRRLIDAGEAVGERAWQLPLWPEHLLDVQTPNADVRNTGVAGGGTIAAAAFLRAFVGDTPWAHLDIAGVSRDRRNPKVGATGFGVRLLVEALRGWPARKSRPGSAATQRRRAGR